MFKIIRASKNSSARAGLLRTNHGVIQTPFFMPIATKGSVKAVNSADLKNLGAEIILSNTYHLYLQPGLEVLKKFGGLHQFMNWPGPILTDSGGYQVFSLSEKTRLGKSLRRLTSAGVEFDSFLDGSKHFFTPEKVQQIQDIIGSDIKMVLDVCSPYPCDKKQAEKDMKMTHDWAKKSLTYHENKKTNNNLLFAIVQGSTYKDLRLASAKFLSNLDFDGFAIGGLAVGEPAKKMHQILDYVLPELPKDKPRYLMGVGKPEQIVAAVKQGIDMFDCVIPTREARHGRLYCFCHPEESRARGDEGSRGIWTNITKPNFYNIININNSKFKNNTKPLDKNCGCELCQNYSLGYLHHLFKAGEPLALRLATLHNLKFYLDLFAQIRLNIKKGKF